MSLSSGASSPGRKFAGLHMVCAEILAQILTSGLKANKNKVRYSYTPALAKLNEPVCVFLVMLFVYLKEILKYLGQGK